VNKLFYFLLFCSVSGAGVLWWLMHSGPVEPQAQSESHVEADAEPKGLVIEDRPNFHSAKSEIDKKDEETEGTDSEEEAVAAEDGTEEERASSDQKALDVAEKSSLFESDTQEEPLSEEAPLSDPQGKNEATVLSINSTPVGVVVFVDGERVGTTPIETRLKKQAQKFRFEKEGYVPVEREAPAELKPEGAFMSWRISMVEQQLPAAQKEKIEDVQSFFLKGTVGPVFVQVRALDQRVHDRSDVMELLKTYRKKLLDEKVVSCEVNLGDSGKWFRILVGPFVSKDEARQSNSFISKSLEADDTFVTGAQTCL